MNINKCIIIGNLGKDPELKTVAGGQSVCRFSVATTYKYKDKEDTTWFSVVTWGKLAENCHKYLKKGRPVYAEGRISTDKYVNKDGIEKNTWDLVATTVQFLGSKDDG